MSLAGGLFGKKTGGGDQGTYAMSKDQRKTLAGNAFNRTDGMSDSDPNAFWGGRNSWTTSGNMEPEGGIGWNQLTGRGSGGGGGGGGRAGWSNVSWNNIAAPRDVNLALGIDDPTYAMDMPEEQLQRVQGRLGRQQNAMAENDYSNLRDEGAAVGGMSGAQLAKLQMLGQNRAAANVAEGSQDAQSSWLGQSRDLRHGFNTLKAGTDAGNSERLLQRDTANSQGSLQAGLGNSQGRLSASMHNSGLGAAQSARDAAASMFLVGQRGNDEDRMLQRYGMLHGFEQDWTKPNGQKAEKTGPGVLGGAAAGLSAGMDIYSKFGKKGSSGGGGSWLGPVAQQNNYGLGGW